MAIYIYIHVAIILLISNIFYLIVTSMKHLWDYAVSRNKIHHDMVTMKYMKWKNKN